MAERIVVRAPLEEAFGPVIRLIVGGIAERANLGYEAMDDLQLAIERLLAQAGPDGDVEMSFELGNTSLRTRIGPLREQGLAAALQQPDGALGSFSLKRILATVVDSFGVEDSGDGSIVVRLEKLMPGEFAG